MSLALYVFDGKAVKRTFEKDMFAADTSALVSLTIKTLGQEIHLRKNGNVWRLNDKYIADAYMTKTIKGVLKLVSVKRSISQIDHQAIKKDIKNRGARIELQFENLSPKVFYSVGTIDKKSSYMATEDLSSIFSVEIPGYSAYIAGYFETNLNQWRDRVLFETHWRSLQSLKIDYQHQPDLDIQFVDKFFDVKDVLQVDTANLIGYLSSYQYFQVNDYLSPGLYPKYDSLFKTEPMAKLMLEDIDQNNSRNLNIYSKMPGERFYLVGNQDQEMMVIDEGRMNELLKSNAHFKSK